MLALISRASCQAVLGRCAARRGDRAAAEQFWRSSANLAIAELETLFVLKVAEDWGAAGDPAEPQRLVEEACKAAGRPTDQVVREFQQARRVGRTD